MAKSSTKRVSRQVLKVVAPATVEIPLPLLATLEDVERAVDSINACYERHRRSAVALAREYFSHDVVLPRLLQDAGL